MSKYWTCDRCHQVIDPDGEIPTMTRITFTAWDNEAKRVTEKDHDFCVPCFKVIENLASTPAIPDAGSVVIDLRQVTSPLRN